MSVNVVLEDTVREFSLDRSDCLLPLQGGGHIAASHARPVYTQSVMSDVLPTPAPILYLQPVVQLFCDSIEHFSGMRRGTPVNPAPLHPAAVIAPSD